MHDREISWQLAAHRQGLADIDHRILERRKDVRDDQVEGSFGELARAAEPVIERLCAAENEAALWETADLRGALQGIEAALSEVVDVGWTWRRLAGSPFLSESTGEHVEQLAELQIILRDRLERLENDLRRRLTPAEVM